MNLGDFHSVISNEANKGSSFSDVIPAKVRQAARWVERNATLKYMERFVEASLSDRCWNFPTTRIKSIIFVRHLLENGKYKQIIQVDPQQVVSIDEGIPDGFWIDGDDHFWFDAFPSEGNLELELLLVEYSDWPTDLTKTHWLIDNAEDLLIAQTMILLAPTAREPEWIGMYTKSRDEALRTLLLADEELRQSARSERMVFD